MITRIGGALFAGAALLPLNVGANDCDSLARNIDDTRTSLKRVTEERDLEDAQEWMRKAKNSLEAISSSLEDCAQEFDEAATRARNARDASSPEAFADEYRRTVKAFTSSLAKVQESR